MNILTDEEIEILDCIETDEFDYVDNRSVVKFARAIEAAVLSKLAEQDLKPVAYMYPDQAGPLAGKFFVGGAQTGDIPLYTEAQLLAAQQRAAEACMKVCENTTTLDSDEEFREGFRHAAKLIWIAIRNGEWREYP